MTFHNLAREYTETTGTSDCVLTTAVPGCNTWDNAGVTNGEVVNYGIITYSLTTHRPTHTEIGTGTYTTSTKTLARTTVHSSTNSGSKITLTGLSEVFITPPASILDVIDPYGIHHRLSGSHADDDEFDTDTSGDYTTVAPTGVASWTVGNHTAGCVFNTQASQDIACFLKPITISDGEWIETCVTLNAAQLAAFTFVGLVLSDGTAVGSNAITFSLVHSSTAGQLIARLDIGTINSMTSAVSSVNLDSTMMSGAMRMRLKRISSTAYHWYLSPISGHPVYDWGSASQNPGFTPTHGGLFVSTWAGSHNAAASFDYYRHMS